MKPERAGHNWNKTEKEILRLLFVLHYTCKEMAKVHGRSELAIVAKAMELDLVEMEVIIDRGEKLYYLKGSDVLFYKEQNIYTRCYRQDVRRRK